MARVLQRLKDLRLRWDIYAHRHPDEVVLIYLMIVMLIVVAITHGFY